MRFLFLTAAVAVFPIAVACTDTSADVDATGPDPVIVAVTGPTNNVVQCNDPVTLTDAGTLAYPKENLGGNCPIVLEITFHLPAGQFVNKARVRFQGDGSNVGVDRDYALPQTFGQDSADVKLTVNAAVPTTILRRGALYSYEVRLVTAAGGVSLPTTLTVSVT